MTSNTRIALESYINARRALLDAMLADHRNGTSANDIAQVASAAWSRPITLEYLTTRDRADRARTALNAAGLSGYVDVRTTGDTAGPRKVLLQISCDPLDMEPDTWQDLPNRIAEALIHASPRIGWTVGDVMGPSLDALLDGADDNVALIDL
ncbi:hypothetical protein [Streptomyces sp. NPDC056056]|uniref:hypothetical protein n=1 Tax=Streptomyces sp. NPDC056056 TaxID=3345698 RepID=UPI0035D5CA44